MVVKTAKKYIGYLEHWNDDLIGVFGANVGKGGHTIFAHHIRRAYPWRNFNGVPWCATFVHSVFLEALGKQRARELLGKPHPGTRVLLKRFRRRGMLTDRPRQGDLIFLTNGSGRADHCGIVVEVEPDRVITIEGNTTDPTGIFQPHEGGAVAQRVRRLDDPAILCYGGVDR